MAPFRRLRNLLGLKKKPKPLPNGVTVGRHSYALTRSHFHASSFDCEVHIGAFCSIAEEVVFIQMADHDLWGVASFPIAKRVFGSQASNVTSKGPIIVGNDVWIGRNSLILSGVTIGDGAVIAAGSVVSKDVPPYAVVAGNPAEIKKFRFNSDDIALLLEIAWWNWDDDKLREHERLLTGGSKEFISHFRNLNIGDMKNAG